jgi:hypothetical protein
LERPPTEAGGKVALRRERWLENPSRIRIREYNASSPGNVKPGMLVLDAGAGKAPYRDLFAHVRYESADFVEGEDHAHTYICNLTAILVEDARFDRVVCNQVLEVHSEGLPEGLCGHRPAPPARPWRPTGDRRPIR